MRRTSATVLGSLLAALVVACGHGVKTDAPSARVSVASASASASSGPPPRRPTAVEVKRAGKSYRFGNALAWQDDPATVRLILTTPPVSCRSDLKTLAPTDSLTVRLTHALAPDGTLAWTPGGAFFEFGGGGKLDVKLDAIDASRIVAGSLAGSVRYKEESGGFDVSGTFDADACGDAPPPPVAADTEQPGLTMTIAGKPFPVRGGIVYGDQLELSGAPLDCTYLDAPDYLKLTAKITHHTFDDFSLDGTALADEARGDGGTPTSELGGFVENRDIEGPISWDLRLPTLTDPSKTYRVEVHGNARLKHCPGQR